MVNAQAMWGAGRRAHAVPAYRNANEQDQPRLPPIGAAVAPETSGLPLSGYRQGRGARVPAAVGALAVATGLVSALLWMNGTAPPRRPRPALTLIAVPLLRPPPPKASSPTKAAPVRTPVPPPSLTAPPPVVAVPQARPAAISVAAPPPVVAAAAAAASPADASPGAPSPAVADGGDLSSRLVSAKPPAYPLDSRRWHEQGTVVLRVLVAPDGAVSDISIAETSGSGRLDEAALVAVRHWRWAPLIRDGEAVTVLGRVRIPFVLTR